MIIWGFFPNLALVEFRTKRGLGEFKISCFLTYEHVGGAPQLFSDSDSSNDHNIAQNDHETNHAER